MLNVLPHAAESLLDLFTVDQLQRAIEYQTTLPDETIDDWETRHLVAAEQLCMYAEQLYPKQLTKFTQRLRRKLNLISDD